MDPFEQRLAADLAAIADTLPPLGPAARQARRTPPLAPLAATVAVLTIALGAAYVATVNDAGSTGPVAPSTTMPVPRQSPDKATVGQVSASLEGLRVLPGFGEIVVDELTGQITVSWSGPVPDEAVAAADLVRANGVEVTNIRSRYSDEELAQARAAITERYPYADNPHLGSIQPTDPLSGLVVEVDRGWLEGHDVAALEEELTAIAGLPVRVRTSEVDMMPAP
jgi:hypothetical protein